MTTWRWAFEQEMSKRGESMADVEASAPRIGPWLDVSLARWVVVERDWISEDERLTIWTARRVYFASGVDGEEWVESVARHPGGDA